MNKRLLIFALCAVFLSLSAGAQQDVSKKFTRLSGELGAGVPILFGSIPNNLTMFGTTSLRYSLSKEIGLQGFFQAGVFSGSQDAPGPYQNPSRLASNFYSFTNTFYQYGLNLHINLEPLLKLRRIMPRINPYVFAGMGQLYGNIQTERWSHDAPRKVFDIEPRWYYTYHAGMAFRYYLNPQLDLVLTATYHGTETTVIDGIPGYPNTSQLKSADPEYFDTYLMPSIGINYKFKAGSTVEHVDWYNVIFHKRKKVIDPDYQEDQPMAQQQQGKISKDSTNKLIAENKDLRQENDSLRKEVISLNEKVEELTNENRELKQQIGGQPSQPGQPTQPGAAPVARPGVVGGVPVQSAHSRTDGIGPPPEKYNVVVGCYTSRRYAFLYRDRIRSLGYDANIYRSGDDSRMLRVTILSTPDEQEARSVMRMARKKIEPGSWIHIYNKPQ
jgi:hypothetical protein